MLCLRPLLVPVSALMLVTGHAHAQTSYNWNIATNGNWNVGSNWNPAAIPGAADSALINATGSNYTVTLSDTQSINNLTINSANATVSQPNTGTLNLGSTLTLSSGTYYVNGTINGGQVVSTGGMRLTGNGTLNNVTLGNAANPDVITIDNSNRNWVFSGSTDFQPGFVPTIGTNGRLTFITPRVLNTGYILNGGIIESGVSPGQAITLKNGNTITATGGSNYIYDGSWNIDGTVKTSDTGTSSLNFFGFYGTPAKVTIGTTGSVIAGTSSGTANITMSFNFGNSLRIDGTIRANAGGTVNINGGDGGSQVFSSTSKFIADGGTIIIGQNNFNIDGTLTMKNGGIISMPNGTQNFTNNGSIGLLSSDPNDFPKMTVGSTPESTMQNPGTISISVNSTLGIGLPIDPGTLTTTGSTINNGTINAGVIVGGGSLGGSGTISGPVTTLPGTLMLPGNSPGKMTLQKGLTLGGQYGWELGSNTETGPGINFDQIVVTSGNVVINSTASLKISLLTGGTSDPFWASNHSWEILDNSGAGTTNAAFDLSQIIGGSQPNGYFSTSLVGNDVFLNWTFAAVPEPGTWAMIGIAVAGSGLLAYRRSRQRQRDADTLVM